MNKLKNLLNNTVGANHAHQAPPTTSHHSPSPLKPIAPKVQDVEKQRPPPPEIAFTGGFAVSKKWAKQSNPTPVKTVPLKGEQEQLEFLRKQKGTATADDPIPASFIESVQKMGINVVTSDPKGLPITPTPQQAAAATPQPPLPSNKRAPLSSRVRAGAEEDKRVPQPGAVTKQMLERIFAMHAMDPAKNTPAVLAQQFQLDNALVESVLKHLSIWKPVQPSR